MNIANIDKIITEFDIIGYDKMFKNFLECLETHKVESRFMIDKGKDKSRIEIDNEYYEVYPNGSRRHAYILEGHMYKLYFSQKRSTNMNFYPIKIDVSSNVLWSRNPQKAYSYIFSIINWINNNYNNESTNIKIIERVNRIDLCCHTDEFCITEESKKGMQGRYRKHNLFINNNKIETMAIGIRKNKNHIFCRMYNKSAEAVLNANKYWFFDIWKKEGLDKSKVWNIEFELHRSYFNELRDSNDKTLDTFEDIYKNIHSIWEYCTNEWLVHKDLINTRIERCPVSNEWEKIQNSFNGFKGNGYITRGNQVKAGAEYIIPNIVGYLTSYASKYPEMNIDEAFKDIMLKGMTYLNKRKNSTFEKVINEKRKITLGGET
ncbi:MAG: hypothetical protein KAQ68_06495 [Clostridiales bacterium]|nr:hypothetical protein [Clostridiales bacterium]